MVFLSFLCIFLLCFCNASAANAVDMGGSTNTRYPHLTPRVPPVNFTGPSFMRNLTSLCLSLRASK
jgi:hypothetical protein